MHSTYLSVSALISISPSPAPRSGIGLLAKHDASHAQPAASILALSIRNFKAPPDVEACPINPAISDGSTKQLNTRSLHCGGNRNSLDPNANELRLLRSSASRLAGSRLRKRFFSPRVAATASSTSVWLG